MLALPNTRVGEQRALEVVQRVARGSRVMIAHGRQLLRRPGSQRRQLLEHSRHRLERHAAALVGERDHRVGPGDAGQRLERVELERREVVEAVDEHRRIAPRRRVAPERVERAPGEELGIGEPGIFEPLPVARVDRRDLARVGGARAVARPVAQGLREARGLHHRALELSNQAHGGAYEPGPPRRAPERLEIERADSLLHDQLALHIRGQARAEPGSRGDLLEQPLEAHDPRAEHRAAVGQLALGVLDVLERRHDQDRLLVEPRAVRAEQNAGLAGVGGSGD